MLSATMSATVRRAGHAALLAVSAVALTAVAAPPAQAAPAPAADSVVVTTGRLVLSPQGDGYQGTLPVTVTYTGAEATSLGVSITEPVGASYVAMDPPEACGIGTDKETGNAVYGCGLGGIVQPGATVRFTVDFRMLTTPQAYAMISSPGLVAVQSGGTSGAAGSSSFRALFRSTLGSIRNPRPYVQSQQSDLTITAQPATLTRQDDGTFAGRSTVTVRSGTDAAHYSIGTELTLPDGVRFNGVDPSEACGGNGCAVPGGQFAQNETRKFSVLLSAEADTPIGALGAASITTGMSWTRGPVPDVDPSDDTATFDITTAE
jgi:hypothetical protein